MVLFIWSERGAAICLEGGRRFYVEAGK